jgi:ribosomal protein S18 acetylase RimI-like enzyme
MNEKDYNYEEPAIQEIIQIIAELRGAKSRDTGNSVDQKIYRELLDFKQSYMSLFKVNDPPVVVTSHLEGKPVGGLLLFIQNAKKLEINPWNLGGHPWVLSNNDKEKVISHLLKESISWAKQNEFDQIHLSFSMNKESEAKNHRNLYESNGFKFHHETIGYSIDLTSLFLDFSSLAGFEIKQISEVDRELLFQCVYEVLIERKSFFFYDHKIEECRKFFSNNFCKMDSMTEETSVAILKDQVVIGFTYVLAFGEDFLFLDWIGIHPRYRRQGLGTSLLKYIMAKSKERGIKSMGLSCESDNVPAIRIYEKNNWLRSDHEVTYVWKKNN